MMVGELISHLETVSKTSEIEVIALINDKYDINPNRLTNEPHYLIILYVDGFSIRLN